MPLPFSGAAAIRPAANVPWPTQSFAAPSRGSTLPDRLGTPVATPLSTTATVTPPPREIRWARDSPSAVCDHAAPVAV
ncbi:hypothetical protein [Streptomyces albogriseolus]